jgi:predicted Zn-ribbon and HTH transcriptional regulator
MINEESIRSLVREAIAKQLSQPIADETAYSAPVTRLSLASHASHFRYSLPGSGEACLIEPTVQCNHCGYCQSHGH